MLVMSEKTTNLAVIYERNARPVLKGTYVSFNPRSRNNCFNTNIIARNSGITPKK